MGLFRNKVLNLQNNRKGFTLLEVIFSLGISIVLTIMAVQGFVSVNKQIARMENQVSVKSDQISVFTFFSKLLTNSQLSYSLVNFEDDNGKNFFDLLPDVSPMYVNDKRVVRLSPSSKTREMYFLIQDNIRGEPMIYDPSYAYDIKDPQNMDVTPTFAYKGLNKVIGTAQKGYVSSNSKAWSAGKLFLLQSQLLLRKPVTNSVANFKSIPRPLSFLGIVSKDELDLEPVTDPALKPFFKATNPINDNEIKNADTFLRSIPPVGGGSPFVVLSPVKLVSIRATNVKNKLGQDAIQVDLVTYDGFTETTSLPILKNANYIEFKRDNLNVPMIEVSFEGN